MADTGRCRPKGVPFPGFRYMKGYGFHLLKYMNPLFFVRSSRSSAHDHLQWQPFCNRPLQLVCFVFPKEVPGELDPLSFHKLCVDMHVNKMKFERNGSLEYYRVTCIWKTKLPS